MHWRQRPLPGQVPTAEVEPGERRRVRHNRREATVLAGIHELRTRAGMPTHQALAEHSGLPVGWLRWAYPSLEDVSG